jgi:D-sedoheptulose 7-phosphate isomerase
MDKIIRQSLNEHTLAFKLLENQTQVIISIAQAFITALKSDGKIIFMGNGGSAADAEHLCGELLGRFKKDRKSLAALSLPSNICTITAVGNDFGFNEIFSRQLESLAQKEDVVVAISTSGQSSNVIAGVKKAKEKGAKTVGLLGKDGGKLKEIVEIALIIPSQYTPRIQEMHILAGHIICEIVENELC